MLRIIVEGVNAFVKSGWQPNCNASKPKYQMDKNELPSNGMPPKNENSCVEDEDVAADNDGIRLILFLVAALVRFLLVFLSLRSCGRCRCDGHRSVKTVKCELNAGDNHVLTLFSISLDIFLI